MRRRSRPEAGGDESPPHQGDCPIRATARARPDAATQHVGAGASGHEDDGGATIARSAPAALSAGPRPIDGSGVSSHVSSAHRTPPACVQNDALDAQRAGDLCAGATSPSIRGAEPDRATRGAPIRESSAWHWGRSCLPAVHELADRSGLVCNGRLRLWRLCAAGSTTALAGVTRSASVAALCRAGRIRRRALPRGACAGSQPLVRDT
jgi:hypothetical protein